MQRASVLATVCDLVAQSQLDEAIRLLLTEYPLARAATPRAPWSMKRLVRVFVRDGFTDRYFGDALVFPGTLRALAVLLGEAFPYHRNWKQSATHPAFWELYPTIDHVVPVARGGADDDSNIVTTSMLHNSAKANWLLEELRWPLERAPIIPAWDGLLGWFMSTCGSQESLRNDIAIQGWHQAARESHAA